MTKLQAAINAAELELRSLLASIDAQRPIDNLAVSPATEQLSHFNQDFQARKIASAVIDPDELRSQLRDDLVAKLSNILAVKDQLAAMPAEEPSQINFDQADARFAHKTNTAALITQRAELFLANEVEKGQPPEGSDADLTETWIPLQTLRNKSANDLLRIVLRTVPVDQQLDEDITDIFAALVQGVLTDPDLLPIFERSTLDRSYEGIAVLAASQGFRDAVGAELSPLLQELVTQRGVAVFSERFRSAYDASVQYVRAQALANQGSPDQVAPTSPTASSQPTGVASIPVRTAPSVPPAAEPIPAAAQPITTPGSAPQPAEQPGATVDFRHPDQSPPSAGNPDDQSKIKPLGIQ